MGMRASFLQTIAAAWLVAAKFADDRAILCRPDYDECLYWRRCATRHDEQAAMVFDLVQQEHESVVPS